MFNQLEYKYFRKRSKEAKPGPNCITMRDLALKYYVCKKNYPNEGVRNAIEELFSEDSKYNEIFNESEINKDVYNNHIVIKYITCWNIDQILNKDVKGELRERDKKYFKYLKWFVLADIYSKIDDWKKTRSNISWMSWCNFVRKSWQFRELISKYSRQYSFKTGREIIPSDVEEPKKFFRTLEAVRTFNSKMNKYNTRFDSSMRQLFDKYERDLET